MPVVAETSSAELIKPRINWKTKRIVSRPKRAFTHFEHLQYKAALGKAYGYNCICRKVLWRCFYSSCLHAQFTKLIVGQVCTHGNTFYCKHKQRMTQIEACCEVQLYYITLNFPINIMSGYVTLCPRNWWTPVLSNMSSSVCHYWWRYFNGITLLLWY